MPFVEICDFTVDGVPIPQGSKNAWVSGAKAVMFDQNTKVLKPWRALVTAAAAEAHSGDRIEGPVLVVIEFRFGRPKSVKREWPSVKPDIDKLERALFDGITDSGLWRDDAQVVQVSKKNVYAERPGVHVRVGEYRTPQKKREN